MFCAEFQNFQTHVDPLLDVRSGCGHAGTPSTTSTSPGLPLTLDCYRQVPDIDAKSKLC